MSKRDYSHWADKRDTWFKIMQLAIKIIKNDRLKKNN